MGFDLYTKLLEEAVQRAARASPSPPRSIPTITVEVEALLPEAYVPEVNQRLALYKRLAELGSADEIAEMRAELADRFGPPPPAVEALLDVVGLRVAARAVGVERMEAQGERARPDLRAVDARSRPERMLAVIARSRGAMKMLKEYTMEARIPKGPWPAVRAALAGLLAELAR